MDLITTDILSGLPTADNGSKYLLVVVDAFTKWVEAYPLPDQEAATCITAVYNCMFARFGFLDCLVNYIRTKVEILKVD